MNTYRLMLVVVAGCCLSGFQALSADEPFVFSKQYSTDMVITTKDGRTITSKIYTDNGKVRSEVSANGMQMISIMRPDQNKTYMLMVAQKMIMEMPYDSEKYKKMMPGTSAFDGKMETVGPDTVDGVASTKYKVTSKDGKVAFLWVDAAKHPLKMASEDGAYSVVWKNYKDGAQDAALFELPTDYQKMSMPAMPSAPAGQ